MSVSVPRDSFSSDLLFGRRPQDRREMSSLRGGRDVGPKKLLVAERIESAKQENSGSPASVRVVEGGDVAISRLRRFSE